MIWHDVALHLLPVMAALLRESPSPQRRAMEIVSMCRLPAAPMFLMLSEV